MNIKDKIVFALNSVWNVVTLFAYLIWFYVLALCLVVNNVIHGRGMVDPGDWSDDTSKHKKRRDHEKPD